MQLNTVGSTVVVGLNQCRQFLQGLLPKEGSREIWIKFGHGNFYHAQWDEQGNLSGIETHLTDKTDTLSRVPKGRPIPNLLKYLEQRCQREEGGVFYVPTQPQKFPLADCVGITDDIGVEIDHLPVDEQKTLLSEFSEVTGLIFASTLTSGGASIHAHLKMDAHYPVEDMEYWRCLAVIAFQSDPVTPRLHQPMRLPGFFRKEKGAYQELLSLSDRRYTFPDLLSGFQKWFEHKGWTFPSEISHQWWVDVWQPLFAGSNPASPSLKAQQTQQWLLDGNAAYIARRKAECDKKPAPKPVRAGAGKQLSDLIQECCDRASESDFPGVDWNGGAGHYRGQCPFHQGKTGNSAWINNKSGGYRFHCSSCTGDEPRSSFEYWVARQDLGSIEQHHGLKGKDYVEAAKQFLALNGVEMPKTKPVKAQSNGHGDVAGIAPPALLDRNGSGVDLEDDLEDNLTQKLEQEFEEIKNKYEKAYAKVERLTIEYESAPPDKKREAKEKLKNAKDLLKALNSSRYTKRVELKRATTKFQGEAETGFAKDLIIIQERLSERLSYDVLGKAIYLDGEKTHFNSACLWLFENTGHINWNKGDSTLKPVILDLAKKNEFCPVMQYLESIEAKFNHSYLDECVPYLFGIRKEDAGYELACASFKAQLIGSVRRIYEPGCHHRLMLILYGRQKKGKSTFIRELYNGFSQAGNLPISDKEGSQMIQYVWGYEVDECDKLFRTREAASLKSFVSLAYDFFRAPYEAAPASHPRRAVMWGTTNHRALFSDPTGNTRYPVISLADGYAIPTDWVRDNRDNIWSAALNAYQSGISNEIPEGLEDKIAADAENYIDKDALYDPLEEFLTAPEANAHGQNFTLMEIAKALGFGNTDFRKIEQDRVTRILRSLGWDNRRLTIEGKLVRRWVKAD